MIALITFHDLSIRAKIPDESLLMQIFHYDIEESAGAPQELVMAEDGQSPVYRPAVMERRLVPATFR